jgi:hypothetical protein
MQPLPVEPPPHTPKPYAGLYLHGWPLVFMGMGLFLLMIFSASALLLALGYSPTTRNAWDLRVMLTVQQIVAFALPALALGVLSGGVRSLLGVRQVSVQQIGWAFAIGLACMVLAIGLQMPHNWFDGWPAAQAAEARVNETFRVLLAGAPWANVLVVGVLPSICEEFFFRGFLQRSLQRQMNPHVAIWLTALVFSLVHGQAFGFVSRWVLGAVLGYLAWWGGSVWPAVVAHATVNTVQAIVAYFAFQGTLPAELAADDTRLPFWVTLVAAGVLVWLLRMYNRAKPSVVPSG